MEKFPRRLKAIRVENGLKQHDMAVHLGLSDGGYQCYEQGRGYPDVPRLYQLAEYFNVSIDYLLGRTDRREVNKYSSNEEAKRSFAPNILFGSFSFKKKN